MTSFRGYPACSCLAKWLPAYEAELQRRGILKGSLRIYQLIGGAKASGGTHSTGGAFDLLDLPGNEDIAVARQMGADATWSRPYNWDNRKGMAHVHGVLTGCPHNGPARYQIDDVRKGLNGLANHAGDTGPRPLSGRTWQQGIAWAEAQSKPVAVAKPSKPIKPWFNAAFLNTAGNNATLAATASKRVNTWADDVTAGDPAVIGLCELRSDQIENVTKEMAERGYKNAAHSNMLAVFVRTHVIVRGASFAKYKHQGKGSKEGMLRVKLTIDGSKCQVGVTHLDRPANSTSLRVAQFKEGVASLRRYGLATLLPDWRSRTVILADINDTTGAVDKAAKSAGLKDAGAGAAIDRIFVGARRKMRGASKHSTSSDHPIVKAKLGRS